MQSLDQHRFFIENKHEILGESDKKLIQEMYGEPKNILYNSKTAKVKVNESSQKQGKIKIIFTLKSRIFGEYFEENFKSWWQRFLRKIC